MYRPCINSILCLLLMALYVFSGYEAHAEILRLKAAAVVDTPVVRVGDIAEVLNADPEQVSRMEAMVLQPAPPEGRTQVVTVSQIRNRLQTLGVNLGRLELTGKSQVRVSSKQTKQATQQRLPTSQQDVKKAEEKVQQALMSWVKRLFADASALSVDVRIRPEDVQSILKSNPDSFRFTELTRRFDAEQDVAFNFIDSNGTLRQTRVYCKFHKIPEILAAKYTLNRGTVVRADDLVWVKPKKSQPGISDPRLVIGRELTRTVHQSHSLRSSDLMEVPLVRRGAIVTVSASRGGITVRREMRARSEGGLGDSITLVALEGRDRLTATVSGYNQAEVNYRPTNEIQRNSGIQFLSGGGKSKGFIKQTGASRSTTQSVIRRRGSR